MKQLLTAEDRPCGKRSKMAAIQKTITYDTWGNVTKVTENSKTVRKDLRL